MLRLSTPVLNCTVAGLLTGALATMAQTPDALQLSRSLVERGKPAEASHTLETYLQQHPESADGWTLMGVARAQQDELVQAELSFHKALAIEPHLASAETNLGHLLLDEHRPSEALPYLTEALRSDRGNNELRDMLVNAAEGTALEQRTRGDRDGAMMTLLSAKAEAPHSFPILLDLSILEDELRLFRDADHDVHEARLIRPEDLKALYAEARVKMDLQNIPAAEQDMRAYLKARPDDATAHYGLGRILQMAQRPAEAKAEFERSIELSPNQSESYYEMGQIALNNGEYDEAKRQARNALDRNPKHGGALAVDRHCRLPLEAV